MHHAALLVILHLDMAQDSRHLSVEELELRSRLKRRVIALAVLERARKKQCARISNLKEGDANTKFFHRKASARKAKNRIAELQRPDGSACTDKYEMADMATTFYSNLYTSEDTMGIEEVLSHIPKRVDGNMNARLNENYSNEEVKQALFQMFPTKLQVRTVFLLIFSRDIGKFVGTK